MSEPVSDSFEAGYEFLTREREARARALLAAREALIGRAVITGVSGPDAMDAMDVLALAMWVMDGNDPFEDEPAEAAPVGGTGRVSLLVRRVQDVPLPEGDPEPNDD